jgi:hypothetical protein
MSYLRNGIGFVILVLCTGCSFYIEDWDLKARGENTECEWDKGKNKSLLMECTKKVSWLGS